MITEESQPKSNQGQGTPGYIPDPPPGGIIQSHRVRFKLDQIERKIQQGQKYVSAMNKNDPNGKESVSILISVDKNILVCREDNR